MVKPAFNVNILLVCKQLSVEGETILWSENKVVAVGYLGASFIQNMDRLEAFPGRRGLLEKWRLAPGSR